MGRQVEHVKHQLSKWRAILRVIESENFLALIEHLEDDNLKDLAEIYIMTGDVEKLRAWVEQYKGTLLEGKSIIYLRQLAADLDVPYYNTLTIRQLCYQIRKRRSKK